MLHLTDHEASGSVEAAESKARISSAPGRLWSLLNMIYEKPRFSFNQVDKAGVCIRTGIQGPPTTVLVNSFDILFNYRSAHSFPLNCMYMTLRRRATNVDKNALSAQRLKRLESILLKLHRNQHMQLSQMQDIGGCRAVVQSIKGVHSLVRSYKINPLKTHKLQGTKDYIASPKPDGYRCVHLMYRFAGNSKSSPWDKLRIEIQIRTRLQHSWATAVETVDTFTHEKLKIGKGSDDWRRFFQIVGSGHAIIENQPLVRGTPTDKEELKNEILLLEKKTTSRF